MYKSPIVQLGLKNHEQAKIKALEEKLRECEQTISQHSNRGARLSSENFRLQKELELARLGRLDPIKTNEEFNKLSEKLQIAESTIFEAKEHDERQGAKLAIACEALEKIESADTACFHELFAREALVKIKGKQ